MEILKVGDRIPPFLVKDQEGYSVSDQDVVGIPLVLYFYPKDDTPGCTAEACAFRDRIAEFDELRVLVLGVSPDSIESHKQFIMKYKLPFSLLSDPKKDMCQMFGILQGEGVERTTFVVDPEGIIQWVEKGAHFQQHVDQVLKIVKERCQQTRVSFDRFDRDYEEFLKTKLSLSKEERKQEKKIRKEFGIKEPEGKKKK